MRVFTGFMKGVNLGGWLSQYALYDERHFDTFITEKDIAYIASLGFDHVRVPVDYQVLEDDDGIEKPEGMARLENCYALLRKYGLNMVIDLHACYGYTFDPLVKSDKTAFFYNEAQQERFLHLWKRIAMRFGREAEHVAFEPLNEVESDTVKDEWNALIRKYMQVIRPFAPETYIITGGVWNNHVETVRWLDEPYDDRVVYNFHCYEPIVFTHQGAYWIDTMPRNFRTSYPKTLDEYREEASRTLKNGGAVETAVHNPGPAFFEEIFSSALEKAEKYNALLYCGEYGTIDLADNESKLRWLKDIHAVFKKFGIGHALWNYKEKDFGLTDERFAGIREAFIRIL